MFAFMPAWLPSVLGFLAQIKVVSQENMPAWSNGPNHYAWIVGFFVSGIVHLALMKSTRSIVQRSLHN